QNSQTKRGMRHAVTAIVGAALIVSPSFLAKVLMSRAKLGIATVAVVALVLFLIGAYLLVSLLKE
ncbi:MAG TPA: hypothetical protein VLV18_05445, partial [Terriglobales bacterium]|nr:hypothetical protein [Terriglobales bacterium]